METWQESPKIAFWLACGIFFIAVLAFGIIRIMHRSMRLRQQFVSQKKAAELRHLRALDDKNVEAIDAERARIAADLHDTLIGRLNRIRLKQSLQSEDATLSEELSESIRLTRQITHQLAPPLLGYGSFSDSLKDIFLPWQRAYTVDFSVAPKVENPDPEQQVELLRCAEEIMQNIEKHAQASHIQIVYTAQESSFQLLIKDDGIGIREGAKPGIGLRSVESRMRKLKGSCRLRSNPKEGTSIELIIPKKRP